MADRSLEGWRSQLDTAAERVKADLRAAIDAAKRAEAACYGMTVIGSLDGVTKENGDAR